MLRKIGIFLLVIAAYLFAIPNALHDYPMAMAGNAQAQYRLAIMYRDSDQLTQNYPQAIYWLTKASNRGLAQAQSELGYMYQNGEGGLTRDFTQAVNWYTKAAEQGRADAQRNLGMMYYTGDGVTKDNKLAISWLTKSAENGDELSQALLGTAYETGEAVTQDWKRAYMWFSVYAATNPSPIHMNRISTKLTPKALAEAQEEAAMLIKKINAHKATVR